MNPYCCLFIPLTKELSSAKAILKSFGQLGTSQPNAKYKFEGMFFQNPDDSIEIQVCLINDMGNFPAAAYVAWALGRYDPDIAVLAGIAGSFNSKKHKLGDVFVSDTVKMIYPNKIKKLDKKSEVFVTKYDPKSHQGKVQVDERSKQFTNSFHRFKRRSISPEPMKLDILDAIKKINSLSRPSGLTEAQCDTIKRMQYAHIFSGEEVIDCSDAVDFYLEKMKTDELDYYRQIDTIKKTNEYNSADWDFTSAAEIVDMESAGFLRAIEVHQSNDQAVKPIIVRGVSDHCAKKSDKHQNAAAENSVLSALAMIESLNRKKTVIQ